MIYINIPVLFFKQIFCLHTSLLISQGLPKKQTGEAEEGRTLRKIKQKFAIFYLDNKVKLL